MSDDNLEKQRDEYPKSYRWQLAESFRQRSDQAANYLRGLLFALSAGAAGFVANQFDKEPRTAHLISISLFGVAIGLIVWSWDRQKSKSIERSMALRDKGYDAYLKLESELAKYKRNETIDRLSYAFIAAGVVTEFIPKICSLLR